MSEHRPARARAHHPGRLRPDRRPDGAQGRAVALLSDGQGAPAREARGRRLRPPRVGRRRAAGARARRSSPSGPRPPRRRRSSAFLSLFHYQHGQFDDLDTYHDMARVIGAIQEEWGVCSNKVFYLAVPPERLRADLPPALGERSDHRVLRRHRLDPRARREALRRRPGHRSRTRHASRQPVSRGADLPHRPLPRQGDAAGHPQLPLHQQPLRVRVEPAGHRGHRHHAARADRRREARRVLRSRRRAARRGPEPPAADARARHDGAAAYARRRRHPRCPRRPHRVADAR